MFFNRMAENEEHRFLSCELVYMLWCKVYGWLQLVGAQSVNLQLHYLQDRGMLKGKEMKLRGMAIWHAVIWTIWLERNDVIFNNNKPDLIRMLDLVKCRSWSWTSSAVVVCILFYDWCTCPLQSSVFKFGAVK